MMNVVHTLATPMSPYHQQQRPPYFSERSLITSSTVHEPVHHHQDPAQAGLGLYPLNIPQSHQSSIRAASPHPNPSWSQTSAEQQTFSAPTSAQQEIYSINPQFESFPNFPQNQQQQQQQQHHHHHHNHHHHQAISSPEAPGLDYCQSAASSEMPSHRSSVCSYTSEGSERNIAARAKADDQQGGWYTAPSNEHVLQRSMAGPAQMTFPQGSSSLVPPQTEDLYRTNVQAAEWHSGESKAYGSEMPPTTSSQLPSFDMHPVLPSVTRLKKKRQRTTPEEATHECRVCGKLFKRSYNWKSHMETHNPERKYPHPCTAMVGNQQCPKRFQRKTDLDRHYDSVHLKARNHKCHLCGNRFARRDTLRRHTEDGCPKRFELGIRDAAAAQIHQQQQQVQQNQHHQQQPMPQLHQPQQAISQQSRWTYAPSSSMAPPMMPSQMPTPTFPAYTMPPPSLPYQA